MIMSHYFIGYLSHIFNFLCNKNLCQMKKIRTLNYCALYIIWLFSLRGELGPGAGENTLRRLALFVYLDHPTKNDVTSGKKVS